MKAARGAVVLFSKKSVSKCLVFLKSKVFGNRGCQSIHNACSPQGYCETDGEFSFLMGA